MLRFSRLVAAASAVGLGIGTLSFAIVTPAQADVSVTAPVIITEVYGGGGNTGATNRNDFIELYNTTGSPVDLSTWSVQYKSATGTTWAATNLVGSIAAGATYLVQEASSGSVGTVLPTPDATGAINMSATDGNVALVSGQTLLPCNGTACATDDSVIDLVGFGTGNSFAGTEAAAAGTNSTSLARDHLHSNTTNNLIDFMPIIPTPKVQPVTPAPTVKTIAQIQTQPNSVTFSSILAGQSVTTTGIVTAVYPTGGLNGYFVQTAGTGGDATLGLRAASDGIWVYSPATKSTVFIGTSVTVTGYVVENGSLTQLDVRGGGVTINSFNNPVPAPLTLPWPGTDADREKVESMLYQPPGAFTVSDNFGLNSFGEIGLATGTTPLMQPTDVGPAGSGDAAAVTASNAARKITLDDGAGIAFLVGSGQSLSLPYMSASEPVRVGSAATFNKPVVIDFRNSLWKLQPQQRVLSTTPANQRTSFGNTRPDNAAPDLVVAAGQISVASFNVLNYFTTLGADHDAECTSFVDRAGDPVTVNGTDASQATPCQPRGAWDPADLARQQIKIVKAINSLPAAVVGLMEIENSLVVDNDINEAVSTLVTALNADAGASKWSYVAFAPGDLPAAAEMDVISNAIIYQPALVTLQGAAHALNDQSADDGDPVTVGNQPEPFANAREPLAQGFAPVGGGDPFLVVVNHFKSKGSTGNFGTLSTDLGDGQGSSNEDRVRQADALAMWVPTVQSAESIDDVFLVGDFNSYTFEDPLQHLYLLGYHDVNLEVGGNVEQSYSFSGLDGSLDHVIANDSAFARVTDSDIWTINGPEQTAWEYSRYNYHGSLYYDQTPFRSSDHDPVMAAFTKADVAPPPATTDLTFLNINDFHGRIEANNTVAFAGTIEQQRQAAGGDLYSVLLGAGDLVGASLFNSFSQDDDPTVDVLNALQLNASSVGNHEFDQGKDDLLQDLIAGTGGPDTTNGPGPAAQWTYLAANVIDNNTGQPITNAYKVIDMQGIKVGIIGAVTQETPSLVSPAGVQGLTFTDPVAAVNQYALQLKDGNPNNGEADIIIAEFHAGASEGVAEGATLEQEVANGGTFADIVNNLTPAVDAIFTGHTHKEYAFDAPVPGQPGKTRPIVQTGQYGERVGRVVLSIDPVTKAVVGYTMKNITRTTSPAALLLAKFPRVATVNSITNAAIAAGTTLGNVPRGTITAPITRAFSSGSFVGGIFTNGTGEDRSNESTLGDFVADALVTTLSDPQLGGAEIGVVNPGGLRADLLFPDGTITTAEANSVLPFVNNLWTITLTGAQFKTLLEQQWQRNPNGTVPDRPYLQLGLSSNVTYTFDSTLPEGSRITSITINGEPYDPVGDYRIGTFSFLTAGGDNFRIFLQGSNGLDSGLVDRDGWFQYLTDHQPSSPDFARQSVEVTPLPTTTKAGEQLTFTASKLNINSTGANANTTYEVKIGAVTVGSGSITNGVATVDLEVPDGVPTGEQLLTLVAAPTNTTITFPITVETDEPAATAPGAPTNASAVAGDAQATVSWDAPASDGGSAITGYTVTSSPDGKTCTTTGATNCVVGGLTNGTPYTFTVTATNAVGTGPASGASAAVTPQADLPPVTVPGAPLDVEAVAGDAEATVSWDAPASDGGSAITGYAVTSSPDGKTCSTTGATTCVVSGLTNGTPYTFTVKATNAVGAGAASAASDAVTPHAPPPPVEQDVDALTPIVPTRVFDTRPGQSPEALRSVPKVKIGGATILKVKLTDLPGLVPASGVNAVSLNVTVTNPGGAGYLTVYPCGVLKEVSSVNYSLGATVANSVIAPVSANGEACFYSSQDTDVLADVSGWLPVGGGFSAVGPDRVFDTRAGFSPDAIRTVPKAQVGGSTVLKVKVTDLPGLVPATGVGAVSLNVTATNGVAAGFVTVYPCGTRPDASSLNIDVGLTVANAVITPVSADGEICLYSSQAVDLLADVNGWFTPDGFTAAGPARVFDTRVGFSPGALRVVPKTKIAGGSFISVQLTDLSGVVPASGVAAVSLNLTATNGVADGFITAYPCGPRNEVSNLNFVPGQTVANAVIAPVSATGSVCFYASQDVDLIADVNGWFPAT